MQQIFRYMLGLFSVMRTYYFIFSAHIYLLDISLLLVYTYFRFISATPNKFLSVPVGFLYAFPNALVRR